MKKKNVSINIILIIVIVSFIISCVTKIFQNDTFFTIALGERTVNYGVEEIDQLVWHDNLTFIHLRWLFDVVIYQIYSLFEFKGIYFFVISIAILQGLLYYFILNKVTKRKIFSFICTIIIMTCVKEEFAARGQIISFTMFLLEFYCIEQLLETNKKRYFIALLIIPLIIVNFHASVFPVYFIFYLPYVAEFILAKIKLNKNDDNKIIIKNRNITKLIILIICGVILGFCSPIGINSYKYMFNVMGGISKEFISELQPVSLTINIEYTILICLTIGLIAFTKTKIRLTDCLFILGFILLSLPTYRCIYFFYLIASICIFRILNDFIEENNIRFEIKNRYIKFSVCCLFLAYIFLNSINGILNQITQDYVDTAKYPVNATNYILENIDLENMRIYNHFNFGSYLELNGIKVFVDSRSEMYTSEFNDTRILEDWWELTSGNISYKEIFDKYEITHALLYNTELVSQYIYYDSEWNRIYQDDRFSIYERVNK